MHSNFTFRQGTIRTFKRQLGLAFTAALLASASVAQAQLVAFPGAEGAGKFTKGGRGTLTVPTTVFEVTSLADTNTPGTLRYALAQTATHRTIVFRVCGTIRLTSALTINKANTTIAGQTAPGEGICLADYPVTISADNVIVRFLRFRMGDRFQNKGMVNGAGADDAFGSTGRKNIVIDHCTMSWSTDEALSVYRGDSTTLQWNLMSEPLDYSYHFETGDTDFERHGYGGIWGGRNASFHHNLFAHCRGRNPRFEGSRNLPPYTAGQENGDFRNNVIYNWASYSTNGGEGGNYNVVGNYYKYGPSTSTGNSSSVPVRSMIMNPGKQTTAPVLPYPKVYMTGNYVDGYPAVTNRNWLGVVMAGGARTDTAQSKVTTPFNILPMPTQTAQQAYEAVLANVGAVLPARDTLDQRIIRNVRERKGRLIDVQGGYAHGTAFSTSQSAWPVLTCGPAPADTDHDGMTDAFEASNGLNPNDPADRNVRAANGYTMLENYLNGIASVVMGNKADQADKAGLSVYPNPAGAQLTVTHPVAGKTATVTVFSAAGRQVAQFPVVVGTTSTALEASKLASGIYLVRYQDAKAQLTTKFVKQ
ncbi:T9SS type A sorting domain-containing protein [Hymenobacter sp. BT635]|uniref:T9SS type A sorting domain-containing protein n=1 Tax=Hymenobacter nitidus TaxID=2880929 RepID=A0ABS8AHF4_9BACT|nr:T9SS type A sorting domain-containing protein [Hymenobacter nitidus]MCB2379875.1 T9SS type A sorting domain-containing protein [Hymenobacter nitidus]